MISGRWNLDFCRGKLNSGRWILDFCRGKLIFCGKRPDFCRESWISGCFLQVGSQDAGGLGASEQGEALFFDLSHALPAELHALPDFFEAEFGRIDAEVHPDDLAFSLGELCEHSFHFSCERLCDEFSVGVRLFSVGEQVEQAGSFVFGERSVHGDVFGW